MMDWNGYRQQVLAGVSDIAKLSPDTVKGYGRLRRSQRGMRK